MPRGVFGTLNTVMQKAFQYLQTVASSKQEEGKTGEKKIFFFYRGSSSSAGYQNYQQRKQTNVTTYACSIWDGGYKWVKQSDFQTLAIWMQEVLKFVVIR